MLYFSHMNLTRTYWPEWKRNLQNSGFSDEMAVLLEALAPFGFLFSQIMYLSGWLIPSGNSFNAAKNISILMENGSEMRHFAQYLMERENDLS